MSRERNADGEREESLVLTFILLGLFVPLDVWYLPAVAHMDGKNNWKREAERKSGADYITPVIYSIFCSSSLNNSQTCLPLPFGGAAAAKVWIGHISHRPGWAAPLLPLPFQRSLSLSLSLCSLLLSPTLFSSLSNPLAPSSPPPPQLSAVDALLTYSMDSGGEGGEGWMEDQWEKW